MTGPLKFLRENGKKVTVDVGEKIGMKLTQDDKKALKPLFDAIAGEDGKVDQNEYALAKKLQTIFAKEGSNDDGNYIDDGDLKLVKEWESAKAGGQTISAWIEAKYNALTKPAQEPPKLTVTDGELKLGDAVIDIKNVTIADGKVTINGNTFTVDEETLQAIKALKDPAAGKVGGDDSQEVIVPTPDPQPKPVVTPKPKTFNDRMQEKASSVVKDELKWTKEYTIKSGDTLWAIAVADLGGMPQRPANVENRIAQIVAMNPDIKDVNNIKLGTILKLERSGTAPVPAPEDPTKTPLKSVQNPETVIIDTGAASEEAPEEEVEQKRVVVLHDTGDAWAPEDLDTAALKELGLEGYSSDNCTITKLTRTMNENPEVAYKVTFDSTELVFSSVENLKAFLDAKNNLQKVDDMDTPDDITAKETNNKTQIDAMLATGDRDAIEWVINNAAEYLSVQELKTLRMDVLKSEDTKLIESMFGGKDFNNFQNVVKEDKDLHEAVAKRYNDLKKKPETERTKAEKELLECLKNAADKKGFTIPAQKDKDDNELVGERSMVFGNNGEIWWNSHGNKAYDGEKLETFGKAWNVAKTLKDNNDKAKAMVDAVVKALGNDTLLNKTVVEVFLDEVSNELDSITENVDKKILVKPILDKFTPEFLANLEPVQYNKVNSFVIKYGTDVQKQQFLKDHPYEKELKAKDPNEITAKELNTLVAQGLATKSDKDIYTFNGSEFTIDGEAVTVHPLGYGLGLEIKAKLNSNCGLDSDENDFEKWFGSDESPRVNVDNILGIFKTYGKTLIDDLDYDNYGASKEEMDKLVNLLLQAALNQGILETSDAYKNLHTQLSNAKEGAGGDYAWSTAEKLDNCINALIVAIDEKVAQDKIDATNQASAEAVNKEALKLLETAEAYKNTKAYKDLVADIDANKDATKNDSIVANEALLKMIINAGKNEEMASYAIGSEDTKLAQVMARVEEELAITSFTKNGAITLTKPDGDQTISLANGGTAKVEIKNWQIVKIEVAYDKDKGVNFVMTADELRYDSDKATRGADGKLGPDKYNWNAWKTRMEEVFQIKEAVAVNVPDGTENKDAVQAKFNEATVFLQKLEPNCAIDVEAQEYQLGGWTKTYTLSDGKSVTVWYDDQGEVKELLINTDGEALYRTENGDMKDMVEVAIAHDLAAVRLDSSHENYDSRISSGFKFEQVKRVIEALFGKFEVPKAEE